MLRLPKKPICADGRRKKHEEQQRCGGQRKETSNGREGSGMLSLPLRRQVWTTIKTEFRWQPSGNSPHITRKGQDICKHRHVRPHTQMQVVTHTHSSIFMSMLLGRKKNKLRSDAVVEFQARGMLEMNYEYNNISLHFRSSCSSSASKNRHNPYYRSQSVCPYFYCWLNPNHFPSSLSCRVIREQEKGERERGRV